MAPEDVIALMELLTKIYDVLNVIGVLVAVNLMVSLSIMVVTTWKR